MSELEVLCLEGNWHGADLDRGDTLLPILEILRSHEMIRYARRDVATRAEFEYYLKLWSQYPDREYEVAYLAFHGSPRRAIWFDDGSMTLNDLAKLIRRHGAGQGKIIHIASCYGLKVNDDILLEFLERTGAGVVCGYEEEVDTLQAAAFELLLFMELVGEWTEYHRKFARIQNAYPDLADSLGFVWQSAS